MRASLLLFIIAISIIGCNSDRSDKLLIATSANLQFAIDEIVDSFVDRTGIECQTVISSSGKLTAQIKQGAPFDVFLSADMKYPDELHKSGFTSEEPKVYARGRLVLWRSELNDSLSLDDINDPKTEYIALPNPKIAPYGKAAESVLKRNGLLENHYNKLVFGESISQTNQFITSGAADLGFTSLSTVLSIEDDQQGSWILIDEKHHEPLEQGIVLLNTGKTPTSISTKFQDFLFSDEGKEILDKFGYSVN